MMWRRNSTVLWRDEAPNKRVACSVLRCHVSVLLRDADVLLRDADVLRRDAGVLCCDAIVLCCYLSRRTTVDCDQDLGYDLVDEFQIRPTNPNHFPARVFEVSLATLLGLNAVVDLIDGLPVLDAPIELDGDHQVGQCDIDEVRSAVNVDFFLCR